MRIGKGAMALIFYQNIIHANYKQPHVDLHMSNK